jgi:hypothetical protein
VYHRRHAYEIPQVGVRQSEIVPRRISGDQAESAKSFARVAVAPEQQNTALAGDGDLIRNL